MKKLTLLAVLFLTICFSTKAQTKEQLIENFKSLLVESLTDFKSIQGEIVENNVAGKQHIMLVKKRWAQHSKQSV